MKELSENWQEVNSVTLQFLKNIPSEQYHSKPFVERFTTFSWEFACLLTTREMYINGFKSGKLDGGTSCSLEKEIEELNKEEMLKKIIVTEKVIEQFISDAKIIEINFFGRKTRKDVVISWLLQHEQLHFGKLLLYCAKSGIAIPTALQEMWGKESFKK